MKFLTSLLCAAAAAFPSPAAPVVDTGAYRWEGDSILQGQFKAWALSPDTIRSTYHGRPGYFMPVDQVWTRRNDLSAYPRLEGGNLLHRAIYTMGLDEMVNAVEPDTTLRTGKEWAGVWTRDVSYSIILSMAALQPEASMISLMRKVSPTGQIIQDTGSGGAWPISTDRMVWTLAAWEVYKVTGDRQWLERVWPVVVASLAKDRATIWSDQGLVKGETSFIDWREQSYPKWMQTADISQSEAFGTNVMYAAALKAASEMGTVLGHKKQAARFAEEADALARAIDRTFWMDDKGYYGMYTYGRDHKILNPRAETLGAALAILYGILPDDHARSLSESLPVTEWGAPVFWPQIADMPSYHNNALWPFVASYWTLAQARAGNEQGVVEGIGSVFRPAALFATNKENLNVDNGDYFTELNSSNMLWSLAGNLALTQRILFGIEFEKDGLRIRPFVPEAFAAERTLAGFPYRGARLDITVSGYGSHVKSLTLDGKSLDPDAVIPARLLAKGGRIHVEMDNEPISPMGVNRVANHRAPLTPTAWIEEGTLRWNPIEYIGRYRVLRNGLEVGTTRQTQWPLDGPGEWQVIGVASDGTEGFASEPRSNRLTHRVSLTGATRVASPEACYAPQGDVAGCNGGFAETDRTSHPIEVSISVPEGGKYCVGVRYANGNGPVNTENKAAVRTLLVDGRKAGTLVLPQRGAGNWEDWGDSNTLAVTLTPGPHTLRIEYTPDDANMNPATNHALIDQITLTAD